MTIYHDQQYTTNKTTAIARARRILIIGLGDAGCKVVQHFAPRMAGRAEVVLFDTDARSFSAAGIGRCVQLGMHVTNGMGAGGNPNTGRRAADADLPAIREILKGAGFVVIVCGLGGGTGTGAAPLLAQEARRAGARVLCVAVMPFDFEGRCRAEQADRGLIALRDAADIVVSMPNQRLFEVAGSQAEISRAYEVANNMLANSLFALVRVIEERGTITLDFSSFCALLDSAPGNAVLASVEGALETAPDDIMQAIKSNPVLLNGQVFTKAAAVMVCVVSGSSLSIGMLDRLLSGINAMVAKEAVIATGVAAEADWADRLSVAFMVVERPLSGRIAIGTPRAVAVKPSNHSGDPAAHVARQPQKNKLVQAGLFDEIQASPGRFKNVEPTIHEGHNLDIPTFQRRGMILRKPTPTEKN